MLTLPPLEELPAEGVTPPSVQVAKSTQVTKDKDTGWPKLNLRESTQDALKYFGLGQQDEEEQFLGPVRQ